MGLFKSKSERATDQAVRQTRQFGGKLADRTNAAIDDGSDRLKSLIDDLESALKSKDLDVGAVRENVRGKLDRVRSAVNDHGATLSRDLGEAFGTADEFAHQKPWQVIGAVAGVALVIGFLAGRS